jgi:DNA recombination protein Rad52
MAAQRCLSGVIKLTLTDAVSHLERLYIMDIDELKKPLDRKYVKTRQQGNINLSYIEGWHAIAEANRIFGHNGWNRETVMTECVWSGERQTRNGSLPAASYIAKCKITVRHDDVVIVRDGTGAGSGFGKDFGEAHESAIKEAETDAMKRALMTFGNPFGLALYDKEQKEVSSNIERNSGVQESMIAEIELCKTMKDLDAYKKTDAFKKDWARMDEEGKLAVKMAADNHKKQIGE